jgi:hypothetical protein
MMSGVTHERGGSRLSKRQGKGSESQFRSILMLAADSAEKLRFIDIDRVLDAAEDQGILEGFVAWLQAHDLHPRVEEYLKGKRSPSFDRMVKAAIDWKYLALKHAERLSPREQLAHSKTTTKGDLDQWLVDKFGIGPLSARDVSNRSVEEGTGQFHVSEGEVHWTGKGPEPSIDDYPDLVWQYDAKGKKISPDEIPKLPNGSVIHVYYQGKKDREALVVKNPLGGTILGLYFGRKNKPGTWQKKPITTTHLGQFLAGRYGDYHLQEKMDTAAPGVVLAERMAAMARGAGVSDELAKDFITQRFGLLVHHADNRGSVHDGFVKLHLDAFLSIHGVREKKSEQKLEKEPLYSSKPHPEWIEEQLQDTHTFAVVGNHPENVPKDWLIFNAPRPIYGHKEWTGDFKHGVFYVGIDPSDEHAIPFIQRTHDLDGWLVRYFDESEARDLAYKWAEEKYPQYVKDGKIIDDSISEQDILDTYRFHLDGRKKYSELPDREKKWACRVEGADVDEACGPGR